MDDSLATEFKVATTHQTFTRGYNVDIELTKLLNRHSLEGWDIDRIIKGSNGSSWRYFTVIFRREVERASLEQAEVSEPILDAGSLQLITEAAVGDREEFERLHGELTVPISHLAQNLASQLAAYGYGTRRFAIEDRVYFTTTIEWEVGKRKNKVSHSMPIIYLQGYSSKRLFANPAKPDFTWDLASPPPPEDCGTAFNNEWRYADWENMTVFAKDAAKILAQISAEEKSKKEEIATSVTLANRVVCELEL